MPFKSDKQRKYLYSQKPEVAKKFAKHTMPKPYSMNPYSKVTQKSKSSMYSRALRAGSQTQSPKGKRTGTGGSVGGAG